VGQIHTTANKKGVFLSHSCKLSVQIIFRDFHRNTKATTAEIGNDRTSRVADLQLFNADLDKEFQASGSVYLGFSFF